MAQQKDTVKYVLRNKGPNLDNDTEKVQRALKYLREESLNQLNIINLVNKWVQDKKLGEFESYAKTCVLSTLAAWKTYKATSFTSSQEAYGEHQLE